MRGKFPSIIAMIALLWARSSHADRIADLVPAEARNLSMGNTGIALLNDSYAMFYNPANLANKRVKPRIEPLNIQGDMSVWSLNAVASQKTNPLNLDGIYPYLKTNKGQWVSNRGSFFPNLSTRFISFGLLYQAEYSAKYQDADPIAGTPVSLRSIGHREISPIGALSYRMFGGVLKMGYSARLQTVGVVDKTLLNPGTAEKSYTSGMMSATGVNQTAGLTLALPFSHLPTIGIVARNIGGTNHPTGKIPMHFDMGLGYTKYISRNLHLRLELNHRDVTNQLEAGRMRRLFTGGELRFLNSFNLRFGYAQGYPSAGLGITMRRTKVDFAWYSEEMGNGLRSDRNQHWLLQITWSLFN